MIDIHLFFSYSHKDERYHDELASHLKLFERKGEIKSWHDRLIAPGSEWKNEIDKHIYSADIILALVSADFMASDYCCDKELERALFQCDAGRSALVPVIVRPVEWSSSPLGKLQALPTDGRPVTSWQDRDAAWKNVAGGILKVVELMRKRKEEFIDRIPATLRKFANDRADLIISSDSTVHRNIKRLADKYPDIWKSISEYREQLGTYGKKLTETIWQSYDLVYGMRTGSLTSLMLTLITPPLIELSELQSGCLIKELGIREKLEEVNLKASLFGFPGSMIDVMKQMSESTSLITGLISGSLLSMKELNRTLMSPLREIGDKARGEDFEEE
ncbi:MAG: toll/interleukin-1 receptor domain-containing protein [Planctomycetota bacterium]|jgi:protein-tyrosine-phosphatase